MLEWVFWWAFVFLGVMGDLSWSGKTFGSVERCVSLLVRMTRSFIFEGFEHHPLP